MAHGLKSLVVCLDADPFHGVFHATNPGPKSLGFQRFVQFLESDQLSP